METLLWTCWRDPAPIRSPGTDRHPWIVLLSQHKMGTLTRLKLIVESLLGYSIDVENVACLYEVALLYDAEVRPEVPRRKRPKILLTQTDAKQVLQRACLFFMVQNLSEVKASEAWKELAPETKKTIQEKAVKWGSRQGSK